MGFIKKLFLSGKKEEDNVDEEVIEDSIETDNEYSIDVDDNNEDAVVIDKPLEITDEESKEDKEEINDEPTQPRNFKYLRDLIHSGVKEIVLDADIVLEESDYYIHLNVDDLIIDGNGHTIDAKGASHIFYNTANNVLLKNIIFKNGYTESDFAAINNIGVLTVSGCTFTGNTAGKYGGAIGNFKDVLHEGVLTVSGCTFIGNTSRYRGGAIYNKGNTLTVYDSTFNENTAEWYGGAIYNDRGTLTVYDSTFSENTTERDGGAIKTRGNFKLFNCVFSNNASPKSIIYNEESLQCFNCNFMSNHAPNIIVNSGDSANFSISRGEFKDNDIKESIIFNNGKSGTVEKTIFEKHPFNTIINKSNLILINPKIKDGGKLILNEMYILIRKSSERLENKIYGEGIVENESKFEFKEFDFTYLDKKIHENKTKEIILEEDISFENYEIDYYEGGIELDIDNLVIDGNGHSIDAQDKTRIFYCTGKNITIKNLILKNGHSHKNYDNPFNDNGGAIKINHDANLTIKNCKFINNTSEWNGGVISNSGELTVSDSTLTENMAKWIGGAIENSWGTVTVSGSTLHGNSAQGHGGAIYNDGGTLTVYDSTLTENTSQDGGGAIHNFYNGVLTVSDSTLAENTAQGDYSSGGAIENSGGTVTVSGSTFTGNIAERSGGAMDNDSKGELTVSGSTFTGNTAKVDGGAIGNSKSGELTVFDSLLIGNIAERDGGAIYNNGELTVSDSTLTGNTADYGGAIYNWKGTLTVSGSTLDGNTAEKHGGAIYLDNDSKKYESNNCTFKENKPNDVYEEKD